MPTLKYLGESYACATAIKGSDYIHLLDQNGVMVASFDAITDFSGFTLEGGSYTTPTADPDCYLVVIRPDGTFGKGNHRCSDIPNVATDIDASPSDHDHAGLQISPVGIELNRGGQLNHGGYIDFHWNGATEPHTGTSRIIEAEAGVVQLNGQNIMTAGNVIGVYGYELTFTDGKTTYSNPSITASSVVIAQRRSGSQGMNRSFTTHSRNGSVDILTDASFAGKINVNLIIVNH